MSPGPATDEPAAHPDAAGGLPDLLPALVAGMGVAGYPDRLHLGPAEAVCLLLVDGLGDEQLARNAEAAPFLTALRQGGRRLSVGFPATTATSLTSLGTALPPGEHGVLGYEVYLPELGRVLNCLRWDREVDPHAFQPQPTVFETAQAAGVAVTQVGPAGFAGSGLTLAAMRGGGYLAAETPGERVAAAQSALAGSGPRLAYVYYGELDATGHRAGCGSPAWRWQLAHVDRLAEQLAEALPAGGRLVVTADHGMVDVPPDARIDLADRPDLDEGVLAVAGEPRAVYVHARPGAAADVLAAWRSGLGSDFSVCSRADAVAAGWFGPRVTARALERIGDVVVAARTDGAVVDSRRMSAGQLRLVGLHGSRTSAEAGVPLLVHDR